MTEIKTTSHHIKQRREREIKQTKGKSSGNGISFNIDEIFNNNII